MQRTLILAFMIPESVAGAVFSEDRNSVLLILRRDVPVWVLPGGGIDSSESPDAAVVREILEETGFRVKTVRLSGAYFPVNRLAKRTFLYECAAIGGTASLSNETRDVKFFPLDQLPPMPPPYREWIFDAHAAKEPPPFKSLHSVNYRTLAKLFFLHPLLVIRFLMARLGLPINS